MTRRVACGIGIAIAAAASVLALVTFDPNTGSGFVGKGDVQSAFGWNNAQVQAKADGVTFTYSKEVEQSVVCTGEQGNVKFTRYGTRTGGLNALIDYNARKHQQIDGFILNGWDGDPTESFGDWLNDTQEGNDDIIPACFNNSAGWEAGPIQETVLSGPSLYVHYGGTSVELTF